MIDWFRGEIDFFHVPIPAGRLISIEADGEVSWESVKSINLRSSHETSLKIKSAGSCGEGRAAALMIDGNLAKFLQGHNVFGSRDLNTLLLLAFRKICELYPEYFASNQIAVFAAEAKIKKGDYKVKMLDINSLYDVGNDASVEAWLHAAGMRARSRHGRSTHDKGTVYLGKTSRRWAIKFYNKAREMIAKGKTHPLPDYLQNLGLEDFIQGKLRAELRIFSKELEKYGITHGYHLTPDLINQIFNTYLGKIDMTAQATLIDEQLLKLPIRLKGPYQLWRQGADLRQIFEIRTFYRYRKALLEFGIDISAAHLEPEHNNVIPLMRIIEAVPVAIPAWAYERGLIAA